MRALILSLSRDNQPGEFGLPVLLDGKPLIMRQIAALRGGGVTEIAAVRSASATASDVPGITYFTHEQSTETGAVMALAAADAWLRTTPVIVSADNIFYSHELVHRIGSVRGNLVLAFDRTWRDLWSRQFTDPLAHAEAFRRSGSGNLLEIGGTPTDINMIHGQPIRLLKFTPNAWQAVEALLATLDASTRDGLDLTSLLQGLLAARSVPIGTVGTDGQWGQIDTPSDVALYEAMAKAGDLLLEG